MVRSIELILAILQDLETLVVLPGNVYDTFNTGRDALNVWELFAGTDASYIATGAGLTHDFFHFSISVDSALVRRLIKTHQSSAFINRCLERICPTRPMPSVRCEQYIRQNM
jgi:hypothetical protein